METEKFMLYGIKTKDGYLISDNIREVSYNHTKLKRYYINGEKPKKTFNEYWYHTENIPTKVEAETFEKKVNYRYELIDETFESAKAPLTLSREEACFYDKSEGSWYWKEEYLHLRSLYKLQWDTVPPSLVDVDFEYQTIAEVEEVKDPKGLKYEVQSLGGWGSKTQTLSSRDVEYQLLDRIVFPPLLLNSRPVKFTSKQMYQIVRAYIRENIDHKCARISSDYDFCFAVDKVIPINSSPLSREARASKIFEMTHNRENYKGYTPMQEMYGDSIDDLKDKVDNYCEEIIKEINQPYINCPTCEGVGAILKEENE